MTAGPHGLGASGEPGQPSGGPLGGNGGLGGRGGWLADGGPAWGGGMGAGGRAPRSDSPTGHSGNPGGRPVTSPGRPESARIRGSINSGAPQVTHTGAPGVFREWQTGQTTDSAMDLEPAMIDAGTVQAGARSRLSMSGAPSLSRLARLPMVRPGIRAPGPSGRVQFRGGGVRSGA